MSTDPGADGFNTASDGSLRGSATSSATDYSSWDWKEIEAAIYGSSMNTSASDTAYASGVSDPQTFYDTANASTVYPLASLMKLVKPTQVLFGTDFPFLTASGTAAELRETGMFSADELMAIERGNAASMMPKYKS